MAHIVMAYIVMAYIAMACIAMADDNRQVREQLDKKIAELGLVRTCVQTCV